MNLRSEFTELGVNSTLARRVSTGFIRFTKMRTLSALFTGFLLVCEAIKAYFTLLIEDKLYVNLLLARSKVATLDGRNMWEKRKIGRERERAARALAAQVCVCTQVNQCTPVCVRTVVQQWVCMYVWKRWKKKSSWTEFFVGGQTIDTEPCWWRHTNCWKNRRR